MIREKAGKIAKFFLEDMNPEFWNGRGNKPDSVDTRIWEWELSKYDRLDISIYYDEFINEWVHCCEIVDIASNDMIEMLSGLCISSVSVLASSIMCLCENYE